MYTQLEWEWLQSAQTLSKSRILYMFVKNQSVNQYLRQLRVFAPFTIILLTLSACNIGTTGTSVFNETDSFGTIDRAGSNGQTSNHIPIAVADEVITDPVDPISINILSNDFGLVDLPLTVSISSLPEYGNIAVEADNTVVFTPNSNYTGKDSFAYVVTDNNGDTTTAIVSLDIRCSDCVINQPEPGSQILLSWAPSAGSIDGYNIYFGKSANKATYKISSTPQTKKYLNILEDLQAFSGDKVCFRIKSYNSRGLSGFSEATCVVV